MIIHESHDDSREAKTRIDHFPLVMNSFAHTSRLFEANGEISIGTKISRGIADTSLNAKFLSRAALLRKITSADGISHDRSMSASDEASDATNANNATRYTPSYLNPSA